MFFSTREFNRSRNINFDARIKKVTKIVAAKDDAKKI